MKIETKHNIGDKVWLIRKNKVQSSVVDFIIAKCGSDKDVYYQLEFFVDDGRRESIEIEEHMESSVFKTKEELIASL